MFLNKFMSRPNEPATNLKFIEPTHGHVLVGMSDCNLALDSRVRVVADDLEVLDLVVEDGLGLTLDDQLRQRSRFTRQLHLNLLKVVAVDVRVSACPDEVPDLQVTLLSHHVDQQRVAGDVEGNSQEHVSTALVELARQPALGDIELEDGVTRLESHVLELTRVPCRHDDATRVRVALDGLDSVGDLVDRLAVAGHPLTPLDAIDRPQITVKICEGFAIQDEALKVPELLLPFGSAALEATLTSLPEIGFERPLGPYVNILLEKRPDVAVAAQEPEKLLGH